MAAAPIRVPAGGSNSSVFSFLTFYLNTNVQHETRPRRGCQCALFCAEILLLRGNATSTIQFASGISSLYIIALLRPWRFKVFLWLVWRVLRKTPSIVYIGWCLGNRLQLLRILLVDPGWAIKFYPFSFIISIRIFGWIWLKSLQSKIWQNLV